MITVNFAINEEEIYFPYLAILIRVTAKAATA